MSESFGARLRRRREEQNIALVTIADQTKIKLSLLEGLERDDVSHWPSGIFRRAYIRAYAHAIGLCPDVVLSRFLEVHPEPAGDLATISAAATASDGAPTSGGPPTRLRYIVGSAIGSLSRFRRNATVDDLAVAHDAAANVQPEVDLAAPAPPSPEPAGVEKTNEVVATCGAVNEPADSGPDLLAVAHLCTELGRVDNADALKPLLQQVATLLDATGLIVWMWDASAAELRPALAHGYSDTVLAHLPGVSHDADNATAAGFRSARTCVIAGGDHSSGGLVVPLLTAGGCAGVFAVELRHGGEQTDSVRAVATIFAAVLAQLIGLQPAEVQSLPEMMANAAL